MGLFSTFVSAPLGLSNQELLGGGSSQSSGQSTSSSSGESFGQSSSGPWGGQTPYLTDLFSTAQDLYQNQSPYTQMFQNRLAERAQSGSPLTTAATQGILDTAQGEYLPGGSKYQNLSQALLNQIRPSVDSIFAGGRFGSGLHKQALADSLSDKLLSNYNQERSNQVAALQYAPQLAQQDYIDINQLGAAGQVPWQQAQQYQGLLGPTISTSESMNQALNRAQSQSTQQSAGQQQGGLLPGLGGLAQFSF